MFILIKGSKGKEVTLWQKFLNSQGSQLKVDGDFGAATLKATTAFQKKCGVGADGKVGPKTVARAMKLGFGGFNNTAPLITTKPVAAPADSQLAMFPAKSNVDKINMARLAHVS